MVNNNSSDVNTTTTVASIITSVLTTKLKRQRLNGYYFYDYEINYNDAGNSSNYDLVYDDTAMFLPTYSVNSSQSLNSSDDYDAGNGGNSYPKLSEMPIPLVYILLILIVYLLLLFVIFICALYAHRRRVGYNYDELEEENDVENENSRELVLQNTNDEYKSEFSSMLDEQHECNCNADSTFNKTIPNAEIVKTQPKNNDISIIDKDCCEINFLLDENIDEEADMFFNDDDESSDDDDIDVKKKKINPNERNALKNFFKLLNTLTKSEQHSKNDNKNIYKKLSTASSNTVKKSSQYGFIEPLLNSNESCGNAYAEMDV